MKEVQAMTLALRTPGCLPVLVWGPPGVGKTQRIRQIGEKLFGPDRVLTLIASIYDPTDFSGIPVPRGGRLERYPDAWVSQAMNWVDGGLILFDEVSCAPPAVQAALLRIMLERVVGSVKLPDAVKIVAAANPTDQAAGGWELSAPLANRFVHQTWGCPSVGEWVDWLLSVPGDDDNPNWSKAKALGAAFVRSHPAVLCEDLTKVTGREPPAYATPRSWESALRLLAQCMKENAMEVYPGLAQGVLGPAVALEGVGGADGAWLVWLKNNDLPDPEELLKDPELFDHDPKRPDRTFATLLAVAEAGLATVNGKKLTADQRGKRWEAAWAVMWKGSEMKLGKDIVLLPSRMLASRSDRPKVNLDQCPNARKVARLLSDFIRLYEDK